MINKIIGGVAVLALILSIAGLVGNKQPVPNKFGGTTNFDQLQLNATTLPELAVASSSPSVNASVVIDSAATTTLLMGSSKANTGSCIQMQTVAGAAVRVYVAGTTLTVAAGTCQ